jgi:hypothetical protein
VISRYWYFKTHRIEGGQMEEELGVVGDAFNPVLSILRQEYV